jgi:hypothetical protein
MAASGQAGNRSSLHEDRCRGLSSPYNGPGSASLLAVWIAREPVRARSLAPNDGGGKASWVIYEERTSVVAFVQQRWELKGRASELAQRPLEGGTRSGLRRRLR